MAMTGHTSRSTKNKIWTETDIKTCKTWTGTRKSCAEHVQVMAQVMQVMDRTKLGQAHIVNAHTKLGQAQTKDQADIEMDHRPNLDRHIFIRTPNKSSFHPESECRSVAPCRDHANNWSVSPRRPTTMSFRAASDGPSSAASIMTVAGAMSTAAPGSKTASAFCLPCSAFAFAPTLS